VRYQLAKRQAGTHKAKQRGEVNGPNRKIYKQKGTGQARHGNDKPPQFRGGGRAFGPVPRSHAHDLPKKVRALALKHALSAKAKSNAIVVLDKAELSEPKTANLRGKFDGLSLMNALIIDGASLQDNFALAARNIPNVDVLPVHGINVYDILRRDKLVLTRAAVEALEERFK
jgi:large subunit ribosomal protein L4